MTPFERHFGRFVVAAVAAGFAMLVLAGAAATWAIVRSGENTDLVTHTFAVKLALADYVALSERAETAKRGYLLDPDPRFRQTFQEAADQIPVVLGQLIAMTADNPERRPQLDSLANLSSEQLHSFAAPIGPQTSGGGSGGGTGLDKERSAALLRSIRQIAAQITQGEQALLDQRAERAEQSIDAAYVVLAVAGVLLLVVGAGTIWIIRRNMQALAASRDSLRTLNEGLEAAVSTRTADLQRANDEIQRFAYIVSHDLRSPLVNVMGFTSELDAATRPLSELIDRAETEAPSLVTEDARLAVREDLPEAIGFIRSSTQKMDRLINAILRLSREGRRVITPEPLKMDELVRGIADSLQHRLVELGAEIRVEPLPDIVSDRVAVEQIFSNLVENAVKYLKPGRPGVITVRGSRRQNRALFEVEDNGRGIDPKDHERVFDLFRRSGTQDQPGEGIGLAHVRALAYRLGGIVRCESALDRGATFRLSMPVTSNPAEGSKP